MAPRQRGHVSRRNCGSEPALLNISTGLPAGVYVSRLWKESGLQIEKWWDGPRLQQRELLERFRKGPGPWRTVDHGDPPPISRSLLDGTLYLLRRERRQDEPSAGSGDCFLPSAACSRPTSETRHREQRRSPRDPASVPVTRPVRPPRRNCSGDSAETWCLPQRKRELDQAESDIRATVIRLDPVVS
jgi:hypothetical protein